MSEQHVLVGKVLTAIWIADDKQALKFDVEGQDPIIARADGDCCSYSWVENVEAPDVVIGSEVLLAEDIAMPQMPRDVDGDYIQYYGFRIRTAKGDCIIDYRNSSNGYYGGSLSWDAEYFYGGVHGQNRSKGKWVLLTSQQVGMRPGL